MPEKLTEQQEQDNRIAALVIATSTVTQALIMIKREIPHLQAHPLIGALSARKVELGLELLFLDNEFNNVLDGQATIPPPGNSQLQDIAERAREVDQAIRNAAAADAFLDAANATIALANEVKSAVPSTDTN